MLRQFSRRLTRTILRRTEGRPLLDGAVGGFVATVSMSVFREPVSRSLPPTSSFLSRVTGDDPGDHPIAAYLLHFLYGMGAGTVFGMASGRAPPRLTDSMRAHLTFGAGYGVLLSVIGRRIVLPVVANLDLNPDEATIFDAGHLVFGLALGAWVGSRETSEGRRLRESFEQTHSEQ